MDWNEEEKRILTRRRESWYKKKKPKILTAWWDMRQEFCVDEEVFKSLQTFKEASNSLTKCFIDVKTIKQYYRYLDVTLKLCIDFSLSSHLWMLSSCCEGSSPWWIIFSAFLSLVEISIQNKVETKKSFHNEDWRYLAEEATHRIQNSMDRMWQQQQSTYFSHHQKNNLMSYWKVYHFAVNSEKFCEDLRKSIKMRMEKFNSISSSFFSHFESDSGYLLMLAILGFWVDVDDNFQFFLQGHERKSLSCRWNLKFVIDFFVTCDMASSKCWLVRKFT